MKINNKLALGSIVLLIVTNPLSGEHILVGLDNLFTWVFQHSGQFGFVGTAYILFYVGRIMWNDREVTSVPKKSAKIEPQKYIKT